VYLGSLDYVVFMPYTHYLSFLGLSSDLKTRRKAFPLDGQGMIATCWERILYTLIDSFAIVVDDRCLAVDWHRGSPDDTAISMANALVAEADTKNRDSAAEVAYYVVGNAGLKRSTRPW